MGKEQKKGLFITFEGSEGSGKSTQSKMLADYLKEEGFESIFVREPGSTVISEKIRKLLLAPEHDLMSYKTELLLYMAARAQIVEEVIKPALEKGITVISDRFLDSTFAYQGYGLGIDFELIAKLGDFVTGRLEPDITFFLDLDVDEGLKRRGSVKDRIEQRDLDFHRKVRHGYLDLAKKYPKRIKVIEMTCDKSKDQDIIRGYIAKLIKDKN